MNEASNDATAGHDPYAALRVRDFRLFLAGNVVAVLGTQMQHVAILWDVYERTGSNLALGVVGLVQFLPVFALALPAGHLADRFQRRWIVMGAMALIALASAGLAWISAKHLPTVAMYGCIFASNVARALHHPAKSSLVPQIVPRERFGNAVTWNTGGFHLASVVGPAVGGQLIAWTGSATIVYLVDACAAVWFLIALAFVGDNAGQPSNRSTALSELAAGFSFLGRNQIILGALTLDLFAVLLGSATALFPVFATQILSVGPAEQGWMRTAMAVGALVMSLWLAHRPPMAQAGKTLLCAVAGFGVATILFGLSQWYWLSLVWLFLTGAFDNVSVVVRHTLVQLLTPDELRGRVSAINGLFISASNGLGDFESGFVAELVGPVPCVVLGGAGTLAVVAVVAMFAPQLRRYGRLGSGPVPAEIEARE